LQLPLNEDCWLAINMNNASLSGTAYQNAVSNYVNIVTGEGMAIVLALEFSAPGTSITAISQCRRPRPTSGERTGTTKATATSVMPDSDHSVTFWTQVATAFAGNDHVIFDLHGEPAPDSGQNSASAWSCWKARSRHHLGFLD
jgi:endoglucanase